VSIPACHAGDPGSIPGNGGLYLFFDFSQRLSPATASTNFFFLTSPNGSPSYS
jgi:hypothetical protein